MTITKNILLDSNYGRPIATDIFFEETGERKPIIIYAHGFNGFKDWGSFDLIATQFAEAGFVFVKFNFAFNGTTPDHPEEFVDLEAYAENNYTRELDDLEVVIDWVCDTNNPYAHELDPNAIGLIGHSMGGGIAIISAAEDMRVRAVATWASISECKTPWGSWPEERIRKWKERGVEFTINSRTHQDLPLNYQLFEDYENNKARLDIKHAVERMQIPILLCHGTEDTSVPVSSAYALKEKNSDTELFTVESDHVFGRKHPWTDSALPLPMQAVVDRTIDFFGALK